MHSNAQPAEAGGVRASGAAGTVGMSCPTRVLGTELQFVAGALNDQDLYTFSSKIILTIQGPYVFLFLFFFLRWAVRSG